jgi:hypothetical protein
VVILAAREIHWQEILRPENGLIQDQIAHRFSTDGGHHTHRHGRKQVDAMGGIASTAVAPTAMVPAMAAA